MGTARSPAECQLSCPQVSANRCDPLVQSSIPLIISQRERTIRQAESGPLQAKVNCPLRPEEMGVPARARGLDEHLREIPREP
jgi:hypothetical protein